MFPTIARLYEWRGDRESRKEFVLMVSASFNRKSADHGLVGESGELKGSPASRSTASFGCLLEREISTQSDFGRRGHDGRCCGERLGRHGTAGDVRADGVPHAIRVARRQAGTRVLQSLPPFLLFRPSREKPAALQFIWCLGRRAPRSNPDHPSLPPTHQVHLCGSFTNWLETVPMASEPTPGGGPPVFAVVCNLPPGYHQYKFIVDGEWRHDENQAFIQDPLGNVNNWLFVKKPAGAGEQTQGQGIPIPSQSNGARVRGGGDDDRGGGGATEIGAGMDWVASMGNMTIKRDLDGVMKQPVGAEIAVRAMGVKGGGTPGVQVGDTAGGARDASRARVLEFLQRHTAYELIPESNKVVVFDTQLPVRAAFHACYHQGVTAAPLWDESRQEFTGVLGAGDFIDITQIIGPNLANPGMSETELDAHTIANVRYTKSEQSGKPPPRLVSVRPEDSLHLVSLTLLRGRLAMAPVLSYGTPPPRGQTPSSSTHELDADGASRRDLKSEGKTGEDSGGAHAGEKHQSAFSVPQLLHLTNLAEVLACLVRHFRGVPSALPLFAQPIGALPIGTWAGHFGGFRGSPSQPGGGGNPDAGAESSAAASAAASGVSSSAHLSPLPGLLPLKCLFPTTSVADAFKIMPGCGALPVVDEAGRLLDVYARADVILLAANHTYRRVSLSEFTVAQALATGRAPSPEAAAAAAQAQAAAAAVGAQAAGFTQPNAGQTAAVPSPRAHTCTRADSLRCVVEALSLPGVRRLVVVDAASGVVEGVVSLSDVVAFLLAS